MQNMFFNCNSLVSLPNISKWDTSNVINMSFMFSFCSSLSYLPDIAKWNMVKNKNIQFMFFNCLSLVFLPDISKWILHMNCKMRYLFTGCISLSSMSNFFLFEKKMYSECINYLYNKRRLDRINENNLKTLSFLKSLF